MKPPTDFLTAYNPKKDNKEPSQTVSINHVYGIRNKYLKDEVRSQCRFSKDFKHVLFPAACMGIKMHMQSKEQQIFLEHKEDIVSFAVDNSRTLMATGQMAEKNLVNPRKKILSVYVWDV